MKQRYLRVALAVPLVLANATFAADSHVEAGSLSEVAVRVEGAECAHWGGVCGYAVRLGSRRYAVEVYRRPSMVVEYPRGFRVEERYRSWDGTSYDGVWFSGRGVRLFVYDFVLRESDPSPAGEILHEKDGDAFRLLEYKAVSVPKYMEGLETSSWELRTAIPFAVTDAGRVEWHRRPGRYLVAQRGSQDLYSAVLGHTQRVRDATYCWNQTITVTYAVYRDAEAGVDEYQETRFGWHGTAAIVAIRYPSGPLKPEHWEMFRRFRDSFEKGKKDH